METGLKLHQFKIIEDRRGQWDRRLYWNVWADTPINAWECIRQIDPLSVLQRKEITEEQVVGL